MGSPMRVRILSILFLLGSLSSTALLAPVADAVGYRLGYGGDFTLTDHNGRPFSLRDARGKVVVIHFGFTSCGHTCPTTMTKVSAALRELGPLAGQVQPLLISVDARRDTPEVLREYVTHFHSAYLALTGTQEQVEAVARQYRMPVNVGKPDESGFYVVDHGSSIYLVDARGMLTKIVFFETSPETLAAHLREMLMRP
jgi:cytochrome oxidase Cu insertion factor (SCO1/SenC/PrrC family)